MLKLTWKTWLAVYLGIQLVFGGLFVMINAQGQPAAAYWLVFAGAAMVALALRIHPAIVMVSALAIGAVVLK